MSSSVFAYGAIAATCVLTIYLVLTYMYLYIRIYQKDTPDENTVRGS